MGNYVCGCSETMKEEINLERDYKSESGEVVEFHPELYKHIYVNKHISHNPIEAVDMRLSYDKSILGSKQSTLTNDTYTDVQGELLRFHSSTKEILVPRWGILTQKVFKYYKNQYSALCKEKALFEIPVEKITQSKTYPKDNRLFIEIGYNKGTSMLSSFSNFSEISLPKKFTGKDISKGVRHKKHSSCTGESEEVLVFLVHSKIDWEKWQKALRIFVKTSNEN
jgi:hypothetical protein